MSGRDDGETKAEGTLRTDGEDAAKAYAAGTPRKAPLCPTEEMETLHIQDPSRVPWMREGAAERVGSGPRNPEQKAPLREEGPGVELPDGLPVNHAQAILIDSEVVAEWQRERDRLDREREEELRREAEEKGGRAESVQEAELAGGAREEAPARWGTRIIVTAAILTAAVIGTVIAAAIAVLATPPSQVPTAPAPKTSEVPAETPTAAPEKTAADEMPSPTSMTTSAPIATPPATATAASIATAAAPIAPTAAPIATPPARATGAAPRPAATAAPTAPTASAASSAPVPATPAAPATSSATPPDDFYIWKKRQ